MQGDEITINGVTIDIGEIVKVYPDKVKAIKEIRTRTGATLIEAQIAVEEYVSPPTTEKAKRKNEYSKFYVELSRLPGADAFGTKKEIKYLYDMLYADEDVLAIASGLMDGNTWLIACTTERILGLHIWR